MKEIDLPTASTTRSDSDSSSDSEVEAEEVCHLAENSSDSEEEAKEACHLNVSELFSGDEDVPEANSDCLPPNVFACGSNLMREEDSESHEDFVSIGSKVTLLNSIKLHRFTNLSVNEGILKVMDLYVENKQSKAGLGRAISAICSLLPEDHRMPTSSQEVLDYVQSLAPPGQASLHYYCKKCYYYHGTSTVGLCEICEIETEFGNFHSFNIASLIKFFFESRDMASIMDLEQQKSNHNPSVLTCLRDGSVYKAINRDREKYDATLIANSDGVRIRKGSKNELWLAIVTIAEVPLHLQKSFLTVVAVWYDKNKPPMSTFLKPFADEMETLDGEIGCGVEWTHPVTKETHRSRVRLAVTILDAPARSLVQNVMLFNGRYGCNICELKSQLTARVPGKKRVRRYFYVDTPTLRTKERMLAQSKAVELMSHVKGVRGPSILSSIPSVDISKCVVPEYLHSCLLGVCKQLLVIWTKQLGPWCIKDRISEIDTFLKSFKHPAFVHRKLRQLSSLKYWKASDFFYFMFFEGLPSLTGHLPNVYLQHFTLFIMGIFKLNKTSVSEEDISNAERLLKLFVIDFEQLYGDRELVSNVHQLLHLALCVRRFGPLHCFSAFMFEDLNGLIAKTTHGYNQVDTEIVNNIKICQGIHMLHIMTEEHRGFRQDSIYSHELLGKKVNIAVPQEELGLLQEGTPKIFSRAKVGYDVFSSETYKTLQMSEDFYVMWMENGASKYGSIKYFAETQVDKFIVIRLFSVDHLKSLYHHETQQCVEHLVPVKDSGKSVAFKLSDIGPSLIKVGKIDCFMYRRPNLYHYVL